MASRKREERARARAVAAANPPVAADHSAVPADRDERVKYIIGLMAEGRWVSGKSDLELAQAWRIDASTVRHASAEASRFFRFDAKFKQQMRAHRVGLCTRLLAVADLARAKGEFRTEVAALDAFGKYADLEPAKRAEVTGKGGGPIAIASPVIMIPPEDDDDDDGGSSAPAAPATP